MAEISLNVQDSQSTINMIWSLNAIRLVKKGLATGFKSYLSVFASFIPVESKF